MSLPGLKPRCWQGMVPFGVSRGESLPFSASRGYSWPLPSTFKVGYVASSFFSELQPPSSKGPCDYIGPTQIIQENLLITTAKSLLP